MRPPRKGSRGTRRRDDATAGDLHGILVVDKPQGMTSAEVVAEVKRATRASRAGHTGTLDPLATGVLPICVGAATKLAQYLLADDKVYEGELELGVETDTLDAEGRVVRRRESQARAVDAATLGAAMTGFVGDCQQVPPMYSALKRGGRPLHELARTGEIVARSPRRVRIDRFELERFDWPRARFRVACSKGTYVRSLVADLGERLGCGAHVSALRRTRAGCFDLSMAMQLSEIVANFSPKALLAPAAAMAHLPAYPVPSAHIQEVVCGRQLRWSEVASDAPEPPDLCCLLTPDGDLLALARVERGRLRFDRVFTYSLT